MVIFNYAYSGNQINSKLTHIEFIRYIPAVSRFLTHIEFIRYIPAVSRFQTGLPTSIESLHIMLDQILNEV